jgi:prolyl-tRNA editing enzyme YbaK/EbsC (Cys-tRNA(Pro) deacylase)
MAKRMSKTLATEIADRTLAVVNPQNRAIALDAALRRHGFTPSGVAPASEILERSALVGWLLSTYPG